MDLQHDITSPLVHTSKNITLYDGENILECGACVHFELQIPTEVETNGVSSEDIEWELGNLGFDGARVDRGVGYIDFCQTIEDELIRLGLHALVSIGSYIALDTDQGTPNVILHDDQYRIKMSPIRVIRALKNIKQRVPHAAFWPYITKYHPKDWIVDFQKYSKFGKVPYGCGLAFSDVEFILTKYNKLTSHARKGFLKWAEGDYLAMLELSKRL